MTTTSTIVDGKEIVLLTGQSLAWLKQLIKEGNTHEFYVTPEWRRLRKSVLQEQKTECQVHKAKGGYHKANHVHHVNYVKQHPELALSKWFIGADNKPQRNLVALCHDCHEEIHDYRRKEKKAALWPERWD